MKLKKIVATGLVSAMVLSCIGCGKKSDTKTDSNSKDTSKEEEQKDDTKKDDTQKEPQDQEKKDITFTMLYSDNSLYPYKKDWYILNKIKEKTGVSLDMTVVPDSDYETKRNVMLSTGELPDIITKTIPTAEQCMSGMLLPISDYVDQMPNYKAFLEKTGLDKEMDKERLSDGKYYFVPSSCQDVNTENQQWMVRKDILDKNNLKVPTTLEELYEVGKKLKEIYPDSTPIVNRYGSGNLMQALGRGFGTMAGWSIDADSGVMYDEKADEWVFAPTTQNWKELMEYTNKLVSDGVLDQEFSTCDSNVYEQKVIGGDAFIVYDWMMNTKRYNMQGKVQNPDYSLILVDPLTGPNGDYALSEKKAWASGWVFPSSVADEDYFNDLLAFIDWNYTDEAQMVNSYGDEADGFTKEEDGLLTYKDDNINYCADYGVTNNSLDLRVHPDFLLSLLEKDDRDMFQKVNAAGIVPSYNPATPLQLEQIDEAKLYKSTLRDFVNSEMEKFIFGKRSIDDFDGFVQECNDQGAQTLVDMYNASWKK